MCLDCGVCCLLDIIFHEIDTEKGLKMSKLTHVGTEETLADVSV